MIFHMLFHRAACTCKHSFPLEMLNCVHNLPYSSKCRIPSLDRIRQITLTYYTGAYIPCQLEKSLFYRLFPPLIIEFLSLLHYMIYCSAYSRNIFSMSSIVSSSYTLARSLEEPGYPWVYQARCFLISRIPMFSPLNSTII